MNTLHKRLLAGLLAGLFGGAAAVLAGCNNDGEAALIRVFGSSDAGQVDGDAMTARFSNPATVEVAKDGTVYVADFDNNAVRAISLQGMVSTVIQQANFQRPFGLAATPDGTILYVQTDANDLGARDGTTGTIWSLSRASGAVAVVARNLGRPRGIVVLADGRIAMSDLVRSTVSILDPGTGVVTPLAGLDGTAGYAEGSGSAAMFNRPYGIAQMQDGSLLVADQNNHRIRQVTMAGTVSTFAGSGTAGNANGAANAASFMGPEDVAVSGANVYVSDQGNHLIRRINNGTVSTEAGDGTAGFVDDPSDNSKDEFFGLEGIALNADGSQLWIADGNVGDGDPFNRVRRIRVP